MREELEGRLLDARAQLDSLLRELRSGARHASVLLGVLRLTSDLTAYLLDAAAERVRVR